MKLTLSVLFSLATSSFVSAIPAVPALEPHSNDAAAFLPRAGTVALTMHDGQGKSATYVLPLDNQVYNLAGNPTASTVDKWVNFDNVWCGLGPVPGKAQIVPTWDANDITHFKPPMVVGQIKCCEGSAKACGA